MNWDDPVARLALVDSVGHEEYNRRIRAHIDARPPIYTVQTQFGLLYAVKDTTMAFSTRAEAEAFLSKQATR